MLTSAIRGEVLTPDPNESNSTLTNVLGVFSSSFGLRHFVFRRDQKFSPSDNHSKTRRMARPIPGGRSSCTNTVLISILYGEELNIYSF